MHVVNTQFKKANLSKMNILIFKLKEVMEEIVIRAIFKIRQGIVSQRIPWYPHVLWMLEMSITMMLTKII